MDDLFRLDNKVAVVIGGGGFIGGAMARGLAKYGAKVAVADLDLASAKQVAKDIKEKKLAESAAFKVDVANEQSVIHLKEKVIGRFGSVDILVNSQGVHRGRLAHEFPVGDWDFLFNVNTRGIMLTCREFSKLMIEKKKGKIINVSSIRGIRSTPWDGNEGYNATKAAVDMITRSLACEWAKYGVNVNAIAPSHVSTSPKMAPSVHNPERLKSIIAHTPLGRVGQPQDMVGVCIFLASSASDYMTGQILYMDGGMMALGN